MVKLGLVRFVILLLSLSVVQCTGINYFLIFGVSNTNPAPEYANYYGANLKGGGIYHRAIVLGQAGTAKADVMGEACSLSILGLVAFGDSSINNARSKVKIKKIALVEYEVMAIGGYYVHKFCTRVHGEI